MRKPSLPHAAFFTIALALIGLIVLVSAYEGSVGPACAWSFLAGAHTAAFVLELWEPAP